MQNVWQSGMARAPYGQSDDVMVSLELERSRVEELLQITLGAHVGLAVAAGCAFHQAHRLTVRVLSCRDYDNALNHSAAALSRLAPIYSLKDPLQGRVAISIDLAGQRFANGATEVHCADGQVISRLSMLRPDMLSAVSLIQRTGLDFLTPWRSGA